MARTLEPLFRYLDGLRVRPALAELARVVTDLDIELADVAGFMRFSDLGYTRNLVRAGTWYHVLVLCWKNGHRSPIHNHKGSACALRVLRGILTETQFEIAANGHVKATFSRDMLPGQVVASEDDDIHQVSNLQAGDADLVSLHVYTPPLRQMGTFSLFDRSRGVEPMFIEFSDAAGI